MTAKIRGEACDRAALCDPSPGSTTAPQPLPFSYRIEKREKYSRRRPYNDDADIDYINERNAKFNKKAERFYGKYTAEIKQNLERGTAV